MWFTHLSSSVTASVVYWLACSPPVWQIVDSNPDRFKRKTMTLVFVTSPLSIKEKEQRLVGSESVYCVRVERHVYPQTVVSLSQHYKNPGTRVSFTNKIDHHDIAEILLKVVLNTMILAPIVIAGLNQIVKQRNDDIILLKFRSWCGTGEKRW